MSLEWWRSGTFLDSVQWLKSKNSAGFNQCSSFGKNKTDTICCVLLFSLQTFDILRVSYKSRICQR